MRSNGQVNLVLTSEKTGADQAISLSASDNTAFEDAVAARQELSVAKDAIGWALNALAKRLEERSRTAEL